MTTTSVQRVFWAMFLLGAFGISIHFALELRGAADSISHRFASAEMGR